MTHWGKICLPPIPHRPQIDIATSMSLVVEGWVNSRVGAGWVVSLGNPRLKKSEALGTVTTSEGGFTGRLERMLTHRGQFV